MILNWFDAREAVAVGNSLADFLLPKAVPASADRPAGPRASIAQGDIGRFLQQAAREARPLKLNVFKRARLLNSFKWKLLEHGCDSTTVDNLTELLLVEISGGPLRSAVPGRGSPSATSANPGSSRRIPGLLAEADTLLVDGRYSEAVELLLNAVEIEPRHAIAHARLGVALSHLTRYREAEQEFRTALDLKANCPDAQFNLGTLLRARGDMAAAESALRRAVKQDPRNTEALISLGQTLAALDRMSDAKECIEKALRLKPRDPGALGTRGWLASMEGRSEEAERLYREALEIDPLRAEVWAWRAELRRMTAQDTLWLEGAERTLASKLEPLEEANLRFAMGKYFDDLGNFTRAFEQYRKANELHKSVSAPYDRAARSVFVDEMIRLYTQANLKQRAENASGSDRPVFVVGMMRSGTSLMEQIIASHPQAAGAGELPFWNVAGLKQRRAHPGEIPNATQIRKLADSYLKVLSATSANARRVIDKSTFNSDHLGLIHTVFPNARIVYMKRDPIDTCLSCYFQDFANMAPFTMDLAALAHYYREHHRLVSHWRSVLPKESFLEVPYAELVADPERWSRKVIEFIGLEWDPRCLEFYESERVVMTASNWQVRQRVYSRSVDRWRNYEKHIGPLLELRKLG